MKSILLAFIFLPLSFAAAQWYRPGATPGTNTYEAAYIRATNTYTKEEADAGFLSKAGGTVSGEVAVTTMKVGDVTLSETNDVLVLDKPFVPTESTNSTHAATVRQVQAVEAVAEKAANKGQASGYVPLNAAGKVPLEYFDVIYVQILGEGF